MLKKKQGFIVIVALLLAILGSSTIVQAAAPYPSIGSATVDGNISDWNIAVDFFADMTSDGKVDELHPIESKAYLRYDITNQVLYALILTEPGVTAVVSEVDAWAAIDEISNKVFTGSSVNEAAQPNFAWVYDQNNQAVGYEASFSIPPGDYLLILHLQVSDGGEYQASATEGLKTGINLLILPEYEMAALASLLSCIGAFILFKKRNSFPKIHFK